MRKIFLTQIIGILIISNLFAEPTWIPLNESDTLVQSPSVDVLYSDYDSTIVVIQVSGFFADDTIIEGTVYKKINLPGVLASTSDLGLPDMPVLSEIIGISPTKQVSCHLLSSSDTTIEDILVFPKQIPKSDTLAPQDTFLIDTTFYNQANWFPTIMTNLGIPSIWRDIRIINLLSYPFSNNPSARELRVYKNIRIKLEYFGSDSVSTMPPGNFKATPYFDKMYRRNIINYDDLSVSLSDSIDKTYLIITPDFLLDNLSDFAEWKHRKGLKIKVRKFSEYPIDVDSVKSMILDADSTENLYYVLLIGDASPPDTIIPTNDHGWNPFYGNPDYGDHGYVLTRGVDEYEDISIGRFSVTDEVQIDVYIEKILNYERHPLNDWNVNKILLVAYKEATFENCKREIEDTLDAVGYSAIVDTQYGSTGGTNSGIISFINSPNGIGIVNYRGHGYQQSWPSWSSSGDSWTNSDIDLLTNENYYPIIFNICCSSGAFMGADPCLSEKWVETLSKGGVASFAASRPSARGVNHFMDKRIFYQIYRCENYDLGGNIMEMKNATLSHYGDSYVYALSNVRQYSLLSDPSLDIWTAIEGSLKVAGYPVQIPPDSSFIMNLTVTDELSDSVDSALVCLWKGEFDTSAAQFNDEIFLVKYSDMSGDVSFDLTSHAIFLPGSLYITATKHNYIPYEGEIAIGTQIGFTVNSADSAILNFDAWERGDYVFATDSTDSDSVAIENIGNVSLDFALTLTWWDSLYFTPVDTNCYGCFWLWAQFTDSFPPPDTASYDSLDSVLPDSLVFANSLHYGIAGENLLPFQRNLLWFMMRTPEYFPDSLLNSTIQLKARQHVE